MWEAIILFIKVGIGLYLIRRYGIFIKDFLYFDLEIRDIKKIDKIAEIITGITFSLILLVYMML